LSVFQRAFINFKTQLANPYINLVIAGVKNWLSVLINFEPPLIKYPIPVQILQQVDEGKSKIMLSATCKFCPTCNEIVLDRGDDNHGVSIR
jgi:hypothetical protein